MESKNWHYPSLPIFPSPRALCSSNSFQTPTSFLLHLKKLGHFNLSMVHSLPWLAPPCLLWQSGWTWLVAGAHSPVATCKVSHLAWGGTIYGGKLSPPPPWRPVLSITWRDQSEAMVFPQLILHVAIPCPSPRKGLGCERAIDLSS